MVRTAKRRGHRVLVIDFSYVDSNGKRRRFRRDAEVQTRVAAQAEERRRLAAVAAKGSPFALVDEIAVKVEAEHTPPPPVATFAEVAKKYLDVYAPAKLKASSRYVYECHLNHRLIPRFGNEPITSMTGAKLTEYTAELAKTKLKRGYRRNLILILRSVVCRFAVEAGYLEDRPRRLPSLPALSDKRPGTLSEEQRAAVVKAARRPEHRLAVLLSLHGGLRPSEVRALQVHDVDLQKGFLTVRRARWKNVLDTPKAGGDREIPLSDELRVALAKAIEGRSREAFVALSAMGKPWSQTGLGALFTQLAKRAGVEGFSFHSLRHSFVTALLDEGVGAHVVQELAGHARLTTTQRYAHPSADRKRAAIDKLNNAAESPPRSW